MKSLTSAQDRSVKLRTSIKAAAPELLKKKEILWHIDYNRCWCEVGENPQHLPGRIKPWGIWQSPVFPFKHVSATYRGRCVPTTEQVKCLFKPERDSPCCRAGFCRRRICYICTFHTDHINNWTAQTFVRLYSLKNVVAWFYSEDQTTVTYEHASSAKSRTVLQCFLYSCYDKCL